ncbi:MAG: AMP-binding protein, partial [Alphaproteobacteria bacterium]
MTGPASALPGMRCISRIPDLAGPDVDIAAALDRLARDTPDALAVAEPDGRRTDVATVAAESRRIAALLADGAPRPAIHLDAVGWRYVAAEVACRRVGRPFVPIDPDVSPLRLAQMALTSGADVLMRRGAGAAIGPLPPSVRTLDLDAPAGAARVAATAPAGDGTAFVVFTSGSTGIAKGVGQDVASLASALRAEIDALDMRAGDRIALVSRAGVIAGPVFGMLGLAAGAAMLLASDGVSPGDLLAMMRHERATHLLCYVGFARALAGHPAAAVSFAGLRAIQIYGDVIGGEDCAALAAVLPPGARIHLLYGSTESNMMAGWSAPAGLDRTIPRLPLGRPWPGVEMWLRAPVDEDGVVRADGGLDGDAPAGELCMAGPRVFAGYWRDAAASRPRMIPHPEDAGRVLFANGDLVRLRPDGMLDFVGRLDNQVKLRGWRIELEEIEAAARRLPGVRMAGVVARRGARGTVDALALHVAGTATADAVADGLRALLPDHMVPARVIVGAAIPLTGTGKVDRLRLAEIDRQVREAEERAAGDAAAGAWPDALSARIAAAIAEEVELEAIGPDQRADDIGL